MRLGVDFGTTRTTVAWVDRGNYPLVAFENGLGDVEEFFPSVAAEGPDGLVFGFEALRAAREGAAHLRSFKRLLANPTANADTRVTIGSTIVTLPHLVEQFLTALRLALVNASTLNAADAHCDVAVGVPAQASSAQRLITLDAFGRAGFSVVTMMNEPSAAGFEYTHRFSGTLNSKRHTVLVYDLGGGTFDASLVNMAGTAHEIIGSHGDNHLGGDDFDRVLAQCAADQAHIPGPATQDLIERACVAKEAITPQTRWIGVDTGEEVTNVAISDFYAACEPLVQRTVDVMTPLLPTSGPHGLQLGADVAGVYVVGGASELPIITRLLRTTFGRRVHRSPHAGGSTAIGLAIAADPDAGFTLTDRLSRGVGVFRELRDGQAVSFDPLLTPALATSTTHTTTIRRRYRAAHNIGHYRFVEFTQTNEGGVPTGDVVPAGEITMPYAADLEGMSSQQLADIPVKRNGDGPLIEESYRVDEHGIVTVTITNIDSGSSIQRTLGVPMSS